MYAPFFKRLIDILIATLGIILLSPVYLLIAVLIYSHDRSPVLFKQQRIGKGGRPFLFLKFRSMPVNTPNIVSTQAQQLRVTPVGKIIRRTNLDELPQFWNVIKGDMSIIGPRPCIPSQTALIEMRTKNGSIHLRPGLTGWAQVNAYDHMPEEEKARLDGAYYDNLSFLMDIKIVLKTFVYFTRKPPVY